MGKSFEDSFINTLEKTSSKSIYGHKQEVVVSVPNSFLSSNKNGAKDFIRKAGELSRESSLHLPIKMETEVFTNVNGEKDVMINIVAEYGEETDIEATKKFLADA